VRQLENAVFRAVVLAECDEVTVAEFPQIAANVSRTPDAPALAPAVPVDALADGSLSIAPAPNAHVASTAGETVSLAPEPGALALLDARGDVRPLDEIENEIIRFAISHYRGQMSEVARRLRIGRSTLYRKLDTLGLATSDANDGESGVVAG